MKIRREIITRTHSGHWKDEDRFMIPGIVRIIAFFTVLALALFITRLATIALMYTGLSLQTVLSRVF